MKAVVFVDVQKDFIDGALRNERAIEVTPKIVEFAKKCVEDPNCKIYATRDTHQPAGLFKYMLQDGTAVESQGYLGTLEGEKLPVVHCIEGTDGWMIDDRLLGVILGHSTIVNKPTFGSFDLVKVMDEDLPKHRGETLTTFGLFDEIVICGFCTDVCVVSNALLLRAKFPNTKITVMKDLCAGVTPESHEAALKTMQMCQIDVA